MSFDPYSGHQTRFLRHDPTGRFCPIEDDDGFSAGHALKCVYAVSAICIIAALLAVAWKVLA